MNVTSGPRGVSRAGRALAAAAAVLALGGLAAASAVPAAAAPRSVPRSTSGPRATLVTGAARPAQHAARGDGLRPACPPARPGYMQCFVLYRPQAAWPGAADRKTHPRGWGATALERAYRLPVSLDSHETVAVSIAGRTPHLARYLKIYREHYGLPPCGTASKCLRIVNQAGKVSPPAPSSKGTGWDVEATLDVSMISAACPHCKILVVEANSASDYALAKTDSTAARLGATVISNSYGQRENGQIMEYRKYYQHPGHMTVASSGDYGFDAANFPANLGSVTAVGGTSLHYARNKRGFRETVWNNPDEFGAASSGCSAYVRKPSWQHDRHCPGRTVADISAVADNVPIYNGVWGGWLTVGGTSIAAPFVSGIYGLAGNAAHLSPRYLYEHAADFFDVTRGNNVLFGTPKPVCGDDYLCVAKKGYDGPTGLGTPNGIGGM